MITRGILVLGIMIGLLSVASMILPMAVGLIVLAGIPARVINPVVSTVFLEKVPGDCAVAFSAQPVP
ncbi:MAG: hypothetical protein R2845_11775 [Thermomicrobiales bacterium]